MFRSSCLIVVVVSVVVIIDYAFVDIVIARSIYMYRYTHTQCIAITTTDLLITSLTIMFATQQHLFVCKDVMLSVAANVSFNLIHAPNSHTIHYIGTTTRFDEKEYVPWCVCVSLYEETTTPFIEIRNATQHAIERREQDTRGRRYS